MKKSCKYNSYLSVLSPYNVRVLAVLSFLLVFPVSPAVAIDGYNGGYHESGIDDGVVYLNDLEDHNWTYYTGVDASVDEGYYKDNYLGTIYSPNPRNVTIEYDANGGCVSISEPENKFVYFKTLEFDYESGTYNGEYKYKVISNPFSKRPSVAASGDAPKQYCGFDGWKIISGGEYIMDHSNGDVLALDEDIVFENLPYTEANCMSATIQFQAEWTTDVRVQELTATGNQTISFTGGDYETNFVVIKVSSSGTLTTNSLCTIMMVEPDGSADYRSSYTFSGTLSPNNDGTTKIEYTKWVSSKNICANKHNLYIGRGLPSTSRCASRISGIDAACENPHYCIKAESGQLTTFYFYSNNLSVSGNNPCATIVIGCDYDRAGKINTSLIFSSTVIASSSDYFSDSRYNINTLNLTVKSGQIFPAHFIEEASTPEDGNTFSGLSNCFYLGSLGGNYPLGRRNVLIEGGEMATIAGGGSGNLTTYSFFPTFCVRMKGGIVHGSIYGGASTSPTQADIVFALTGGSVVGWVAGGCNGVTDSGGQTCGKSLIYVGGNCRIDSHGSEQIIGAASVGGHVYGAGSGRENSRTCGEMTYGTNVAISDKSYIERNVFAGGNYGYSKADSRIYVTGGEVNGGVYGGANQQSGKGIDIFMTGGTVGSGLYGGSNFKGTKDGDVNVKLIGGTVGTSSIPANIHGGGYGTATEVKGNISVSIGSASGDALTANKDNISDLTIYGDVYGGSALGKTNTGSSKTTAVNMYSGTVNGNVYGGALGSADGAATIGATVQTIDIYGGKVTGGVFGGSNINASMTAATLPRQGVTVHDTWTPTVDGEYAIGSVFGGGNNLGGTLLGSITVNIEETGCRKIEMGELYGCGNMAAYSTPSGKSDPTVNILSATRIGSVYGGGNRALVTGNPSVAVTGGTHGSIFGGGNEANVNGTPTVTVTGSETRISGNVFGGGNQGDVTGSPIVTIGE